MLIGDAAGHVNPISGEGIVYALIDGELAAQAIAGNTFQLFDTLWKRAFGWDLYVSIKLRPMVLQSHSSRIYVQLPQVLESLFNYHYFT